MATTPAIDYTSKDFMGFRESLLSYAKTTIPEWTSRSPADFGVVLVEMMSYGLDILSYYQDRLIGEAYLATATQRSSVLEIARTLGYIAYPAQAATGTVTLATDTTQTTDVTVPAGTQVITGLIETYGGPLTYETLADVTVPAAGGTATVAVVEGATQVSETITLTPDNASSQSIPVVDLGASTGSVDQVFSISRTPVDLSTVRVFGIYPAGPVEWVITDSLLDATSSERSVELRTDADGIVSVVFGDGVNGAIPESGTELKVAYRLGGGARGNASANSISDIASVISGVSVLSSSEMTGGYDAESTESVRRNAPAAWGTQDRAVTADDYAALALAVPGVDKAKALGQSTSLITVFLLGARNSTPAVGLFEQVTAYVQSRAMAGVTVVTQAGTLVPVNFGTAADPVTVGVMPQYRRTDVQLAVTQALQRMLDADNTTFAQRVTVADAYAAVHDIPGVLYVHIPMMARADQSQTGTDDVLCREWEVPVPGAVSITAVGGI